MVNDTLQMMPCGGTGEEDWKKSLKLKIKENKSSIAVLAVLCAVIIAIVAVLCAEIIAIVVAVTQKQSKVQVQTPASKFHHALFHLKTKGYKELEGMTYLQWIKDENQQEGDIELINGTYITIPQDGVYDIKFVVQLYFSEDTPDFHLFLTLYTKNETKIESKKKTLHSLDKTKHEPIELSVKYKLKANDRIFLKMNRVKFISPDKHTSHLSITVLKINEPQ
ncbi:XP_029654294.1uncharacterized protein LOC115227685 [Octopus vulgaris]|uniref:XP_029654294.1uncharacterized protein LOC115227685 n=1 Tax=Octopus vulgaris TaxID=6645 RepID=A0AA36FIE3_OCTVU|nr:XP_029654294.1uncharacterized protein LOC115227685 [Octopus vulgaris]